MCRITNSYTHSCWIANPAEQVLLRFAKRLRCDFAGLKQKLLNEYIYIEDALWRKSVSIVKQINSLVILTIKIQCCIFASFLCINIKA